MNFGTWEPAYEAILADFGYPRDADERARDELGELVGRFDEDRFPHLEGRTVAIAGGADTLRAETAVAAGADVVVAASTAADVLRAAGVDVHLVTTDLDKTPATAAELTGEGVPVVVHAHGDNRETLREWVPRMDRDLVLPTTQAAPAGAVRNFGGFTDGDRAAFLADHFGAAALRFPGWDFDDSTVAAGKRRKLAWAERLLGWLERRRDERFPVLDGRRESLDLSFVPERA